jgi:uncharacterized protein (DUF1501 family)
MIPTGCHNYFQTRGPTRREILRAGTAGLFGLTLPQLLAGKAPAAVDDKTFGKAKACILLFMWGGPAHQDTWDMKPDQPEQIRGEFKPIATKVPGIQICEHMPQLAQRTDKLCIVRSMTHSNADHTTGTSFLLTGQPPVQSGEIRSQWPQIGAVLSKLGRGRGVLPPFVSLRPKPEPENDVPRFLESSQGQFGGWLGPVFDPMIIDHDPLGKNYRVAEMTLRPELSVTRLEDRRTLLKQIDEQLRQGQSPNIVARDKNNERAFQLLTSAATEKGAFNLAEEPQKVRERYGMNCHGQSVLQARRLIERGVPLVTVYWPSEGIKNVSILWDTHSRNFIDLKSRLMPPADQAFSALLDDLSERNMLDETLVVWTGEFGRTPKVGQRNSDAGAGADGRDHWPNCFTTVLAGGGVRGGMVYGKSDKQAAFPASDPVAPLDLVSTVYHLLGVPEEQTLPDLSGRPTFIRPGKAIAELMA